MAARRAQHAEGPLNHLARVDPGRDIAHDDHYLVFKLPADHAGVYGGDSLEKVGDLHQVVRAGHLAHVGEDAAARRI